MNIAVWLSLAVAENAVCALPQRGEAHSAYALDGGRVLLQVVNKAKCAKKVAEVASGEAEVAGSGEYFMSQDSVHVPQVRLAPSLGSRIRRAMRSLASGFEQSLAAPVAGAAAGIFSFAVTALVFGPGAVLSAADFPADASRLAQNQAVRSQVLVAEVNKGKTAHHAFRRGSKDGLGLHLNVPQVHNNNPYDPDMHYDTVVGEFEFAGSDGKPNGDRKPGDDGKSGGANVPR